IVYHAVAGEGEPAGGRFLKPYALVAAKFKTSSTADIVSRFVMESSIGNFGVYFGDETGGNVHPITAKDAKA
ncbi:flavin reductase, partial [Rhizobium leguminosarum]